ncbi:hypothetical protein F4677DRAFT_369790 [Hypoxylon crocopeplum]|nr:hypothetical protein F4677DRAFT_369790 [Hypoxylon crocopeplum]
MDHLALPKGKGHIRIPNLTLVDYTRRDGGFEGYPARSGWSIDDSEGIDSFSGRPTIEVEAFFQTWLYFGFAIEVLAVSGIIIQPSDLLDEERKYVSTRQLPVFLRQWRQRAIRLKRTDPSHIDSVMKISLILKRVSSFVDTYCLPYYGRRDIVALRRAQSSSSPIPENIWVSIIGLGHTLMEAMIRYYDIARLPNHWGASTLLQTRLLRKGWCPMDVERILTDLGIDGHYYISRMLRPDSEISHKNCTRSQCDAQNIDEKNYKQKHVREGCNCNAREVNTAHLCEIIEHGEVPVFNWDSGRSELRITSANIVKRGVSQPAYIAIFHVWSDGMGNSAKNALLECQLQHIQDKVEALVESSELSAKPRHFWLDTLCIPVDKSKKELRRECIRKMGNIYRGAAAVLALSSTLKRVAMTDGNIDRNLATYFANWNRRLWTFQEGMLAKRLFIQLSDRAVDIFQMPHPDVGKSVAIGRCVTFPLHAYGASMMTHFGLLRHVLWDGPKDPSFEGNPRGARKEPLNLLINGVQYRSTSRRSDETICLGTLLRLKIRRLQGAEEAIREEYSQRGLHADEIPDREIAERRMEIFWSMVKVFPRDVVFNSHERLAKEGYGWAPASLLGIPPRGFSRSTARGFSDTFFDKENCGLSFTGPGIIIRVPTGGETSSALFNTHVTVDIPYSDHETLKMRIEATGLGMRSNNGGFSWKPGTRYGVILSESIAQSSRDNTAAGRPDWVPTNVVSMNLWLEQLFPELKESEYFSLSEDYDLSEHEDSDDLVHNSMYLKKYVVDVLNLFYSSTAYST